MFSEQNNETVRRYWESQYDFILKRKDDYFSPLRYEDAYEEHKAKRHGLLASALIAISHGITIIAGGVVDLGIAHIKWAKKFAETAIEVGDFGQYYSPPYPPELGLQINYHHLAFANWVLSGTPDLENEGRSLDKLRILGANAYADSKERRADDRWLDTWIYVVPFLIAGDVTEAKEQFSMIHGDVKVDATRVSANGQDFVKVTYLLLLHLTGQGITRETAIKAIEKYYFNITGWGREGKRPRDRFWNTLTPEQHVAFARVRARFITGERDPIAVIRSIRGVPIQ
jgi:hypothetical protein